MIDTWNHHHNIYRPNYRFIAGNLIIIKPILNIISPSLTEDELTSFGMVSSWEPVCADASIPAAEQRNTFTLSANQQLTCSVSRVSACALTCEPLTAGSQREWALLHRQLVEFSELWRHRYITLQSFCMCYMRAKSLCRELWENKNWKGCLTSGWGMACCPCTAYACKTRVWD